MYRSGGEKEVFAREREREEETLLSGCMGNSYNEAFLGAVEKSRVYTRRFACVSRRVKSWLSIRSFSGCIDYLIFIIKHAGLY